MPVSASLPATFYPELADGLRQVFFVYSLDEARLVYVNRAYERVLGGSQSQADVELPELLARLHPDDQQFAVQCWKLWQRGRLTDDVELRLLRPDGSVQWLCLAPYYTATLDSALLSGFVSDITATKESMLNANKFNAKKNATLEILSHDLAAPFILLQQLAGYVEEKIESLHDDDLNRMVEVMRTTCQDSVNLIRDFVDQEFLESANVKLRLDRLDLVERLRLMMEEYQENQALLHKQFQFTASHAVIYAEVDENKFMQVLNNLISNSIKFTPDGGLIHLSVEQHPSHVLITVADNGIGIPEHLQEGLFERFTKARRPGLRGEKTTGLGMSIIKTIVNLHGGHIRVESAENQGATFCIELPYTHPGQGHSV